MLTINTKAIVGRVRQVGRVGQVRGLRRLGGLGGLGVRAARAIVGQGENCELGTSCKLALAGVDIPKSPLGQMKYLKELGF